MAKKEEFNPTNANVAWVNPNGTPTRVFTRFLNYVKTLENRIDVLEAQNISQQAEIDAGCPP